MFKSGLSSFSSGGVVAIVGGESLVSNGEDDISMGGSERTLHWFFGLRNIGRRFVLIVGCSKWSGIEKVLVFCQVL